MLSRVRIILVTVTLHSDRTVTKMLLYQEGRVPEDMTIPVSCKSLGETSDNGSSEMVAIV